MAIKKPTHDSNAETLAAVRAALAGLSRAVEDACRHPDRLRLAHLRERVQALLLMAGSAPATEASATPVASSWTLPDRPAATFTPDARGWRWGSRFPCAICGMETCKGALLTDGRLCCGTKGGTGGKGKSK